MPDHNRPTDDRTQTTLLGWLPSWKDPVTPVTVGIFAIIAFGLFLLRRQADHVTPLLFVAIAYLVSPAGDWWEGKRRVAAVSLVAALAASGAVISWETGGWWLLIPLPLAWWIPYAIGHGRGSNKSNEQKIRHGLKLIEQGLRPVIEQQTPPGTKIRKPRLEGGKVKTPIKLPPSSPRGSAPLPADLSKFGLASKIANPINFKAGEIDVIDTSRTTAAGEAVVTLHATTPFGKKPGPRPPLEQWPNGMIPIGEHAYGDPGYVGRHHVVAGAETGAGKTWLLENFAWCNIKLARTVALIDPKRVAFAKYRHCIGVTYAADPLDMLNLLRSIQALMDSRYRTMEAEGIEEWPEERGWATVIIDETADLLATVPDAGPILVRLYQLARAAGIQVIAATQRPDAQSIPPLVKANAPTVIGLRVANAVAERVMWEDAAQRGIKLNDRTLPPGRCYIETPGQPGAWLQVYPTPRADGLPRLGTPTQPAQPPDSCPPHAGETTVAEVDRNPTNATDATMEPDQRTPRQIIEDNLFPDDPITAAALAVLAGCTPQNVSKILAKMATDGLAVRVRGGWVSAPSRDRAA